MYKPSQNCNYGSMFTGVFIHPSIQRWKNDLRTIAFSLANLRHYSIKIDISWYSNSIVHIILQERRDRIR